MDSYKVDQTESLNKAEDHDGIFQQGRKGWLQYKLHSTYLRPAEINSYLRVFSCDEQLYQGLSFVRQSVTPRVYRSDTVIYFRFQKGTYS